MTIEKTPATAGDGGNPTRGPWQVRIHGWQTDLEHLARHFTSERARVTKDKDGFLYESDAFTACDTSAEVLAVADEELKVLSGVLILARQARDPLHTDGAVYRRNAAGGRDVFMHLREALHLKVEVSESLTDSQGNVVSRPSPPPQTILLSRLATSDAAVAKVLRLLAAKDAKTWVGLYRLYEVIEHDAGGEKGMRTRAWSSPTLDRFARCANSVAVAGDSARHGTEVTEPPKRPMSLADAEACVHKLMNDWLASKTP